MTSLSENAVSQHREIGRQFMLAACCSEEAARVLAKRDIPSLSERGGQWSTCQQTYW
ncbi:hypothetical protein A2U01_0052366 [Trifolium medium]|uniref:Uncharacterized protein n=1 Tax=Trifolium medium TaxID=97028 RepID=A0A392R6K2_9FABA|nr:hypothetical protein [Trifolium medium]